MGLEYYPVRQNQETEWVLFQVALSGDQLDYSTRGGLTDLGKNRVDALMQTTAVEEIENLLETFGGTFTISGPCHKIENHIIQNIVKRYFTALSHLVATPNFSCAKSARQDAASQIKISWKA